MLTLLTIDADAYQKAGFVNVCMRQRFDTEADFVHNALTTRSMNEPLAEAFGPPAFTYQGSEYLTENWLLEHDGHQVLVATAPGRGTSYECLAKDLPAEFGYNEPAWWQAFLGDLVKALAATTSGAEREREVRKQIAKAFK